MDLSEITVIGWFFLILGGISIIFLALIPIMFIVHLFRPNGEDPVDVHVRNLMAGGLIPRVHKSIHEMAMTKIGRDNQHINLPRRQYFDD